MVEEHIKQYVKERLKAGVPRSHIEEVLAVMGLTKKEIAEAFKFDEVEKSGDIEDLFITSIESSSTSNSTLMESAPETIPKETLSEKKTLKEEVPEKPAVEPIVQPIKEVKQIESKAAKSVIEEPSAKSLGETKDEEPQEILEEPIIEPLSESKKVEKKEPSVEPVIKEPKSSETKLKETPPEESTTEALVPEGLVEYVREEKKPIEIPPVTPTKQFAGYKPVPVTQVTPAQKPQEVSETGVSGGKPLSEKQETPVQIGQPEVEPQSVLKEPKIETIQQTVPTSQTKSPTATTQVSKVESKQIDKKNMVLMVAVPIVMIIVVIVGGIGMFLIFLNKPQPPTQTEPVIQIKKISVSCDATKEKLIITNEGTHPINTREDGLTILVAGETYEDASNKTIPPGNSTEYSWDIIKSLSPGVKGVVFGDTIPVIDFTC